MTAAVWACGIAGVAAVFGSFDHWVQATLSDRGAHLLVVTRSGWDLPPSGQVVFALGLVALISMLTADPGGNRRWLGLAPAAAGAVIVAVTTMRVHAAEPITRTLARLRIGTFQTEKPTVAAGTATGLWICVAAGVLMMIAGIIWVALDRPARTSVDVPTDAPVGTEAQ
ncbi:Trp biosynthesis-associated membrane protein [Parafrankia sp. EUN1f]|uniref:Trp biosynthesis-associated membrane protein n=1 Tax=Parafrankia sp. EUN1f TaxID=102897 RepID=UPI000682DD12|nr:Trp biosynthesis-associated membrane protein [Parafrankia sp. EUN1f]